MVKVVQLKARQTRKHRSLVAYFSCIYTSLGGLQSAIHSASANTELS